MQLSRPIFVFDSNALNDIAVKHREQYSQNLPFPHTVIDNFLPKEVVDQVVALFPSPNASFWLDRRSEYQPGKLGIGKIERIENEHPFLHNIMFAFNSAPLINFLELLTGIDGLLPDPHLQGGGLHQILSGGKLAIHADFNYNQKIKLYRRINLLLYLNKNWKDRYGGHLELWNKDVTTCVKRISPIFNRCVIFNTDSKSYHGHPEPLACPDQITRKSLAFYYYARNPQSGDEEVHQTLWQKRPTD